MPFVKFRIDNSAISPCDQHPLCFKLIIKLWHISKSFELGSKREEHQLYVFFLWSIPIFFVGFFTKFYVSLYLSRICGVSCISPKSILYRFSSIRRSCQLKSAGVKYLRLSALFWLGVFFSNPSYLRAISLFHFAA